MWVNRALFDTLLTDHKAQADQLTAARVENAALRERTLGLLGQKAKDDMSLDWMRHRVNELSKINAQLLVRATGIAIPVPEIVPTRPGTISELPAVDVLPSFEDVGDTEAARLGIAHTDSGELTFVALTK